MTKPKPKAKRSGGSKRGRDAIGPSTNGTFEHPERVTLVATGAITASALIGADWGAGATLWYRGYELDGPGFLHALCPATHQRAYRSREDAIRAAKDALDRKLQDELHGPRGKRHDAAIQRARTLLAEFAAVRPDVPKSIADEVSRKGAKPQSNDPRPSAKSAVTILALPAPAALVATESLSTAEAKQLRQCETEIERSGQKALEAIVARGRALREIRDSRLYRKTHATFDAYVAERWQLKRTPAYELIDASNVYDLAAPIAAKLNLHFTAPAQFRPLASLVESKADIEAVLKRVARNIEANGQGEKRPTMEAIEAAKREETTSPDDLKHEREKAKERKAETRTAAAQTPREASGWPQEAIEGDDAPEVAAELLDSGQSFNADAPRLLPSIDSELKFLDRFVAGVVARHYGNLAFFAGLCEMLRTLADDIERDTKHQGKRRAK